MLRKNAQSIGDIIKQTLKNRNLESKVFEEKILKLWPEILGAEIASYTDQLFLKNKTLYVKITSSALRNELYMCRSRLVNTINQHLGASVIETIIFR